MNDVIRPAEVVAYLRARGWKVADDGYQGGVLWELQTEADTLEAFVPMAEGAPDYGTLVHRLVHTLARVERRDPIFILREMKESTSDIIRFRVALDGRESSRLPLSLAPRVFKAAHDVTISAANATMRRRSHYRKWTRDVYEFAQQAEVGQTEPGSYVVRVLCPLKRLPEPQLQLQGDEPFGRRVTATLNTALAASTRAARAAITSGDLETFDETIQAGVSSNLCSALASVNEGSLSTTLGVELRWARLKAVAAPAGGSFYFGSDVLDVFQSAAKYLRDQEEEVLEGQTVHGYVTRCERGSTEDSGVVVVEGWIETPDFRGRVACRIELSGADYVSATRAHGDRDFVSVTGTVHRVGSKWSMGEVEGLNIGAQTEGS